MSDLHYLYNSLLSGKTCEVLAHSVEASVAFRNAFAIYKMRRDQLLVSVGILEPEDVAAVSFKRILSTTSTLYQSSLLQIQFNPSDGPVETGFTIIEDGAEGLDDAAPE